MTLARIEKVAFIALFFSSAFSQNSVMMRTGSGVILASCTTYLYACVCGGGMGGDLEEGGSIQQHKTLSNEPVYEHNL